MDRFRRGLTIDGVRLLQDDEGRLATQPADGSIPPIQLKYQEQEELTALLQRFQRPESRRSFRVPLAQLPQSSSEISVLLHVDGKAIPAIPIDLSLNGLRVALLERVVDAETVHVELTFEGTDVHLTGHVTRRNAHEMALNFEFTTDGEPDALGRLHRELERSWLRNRPGKMTTTASSQSKKKRDR